MVSAAPDIATLSQDAGADDYIEKPFEIRQLLELINKYVNGEAKTHSDMAPSRTFK
jgi:DNA-binding response OmpR family regulator